MRSGLSFKPKRKTMTVHNHAVVWIDHRTAKIFYLGLDSADERKIDAKLENEHLHHKANTIGSGKTHDDPTFFPRIDEALAHCEAVLLVGPGNEKILLLKHLGESSGSHKGRDLHAEPADHPSDREIIALGRRHFRLGEAVRETGG
jgi:hypothetical protein